MKKFWAFLLSAFMFATFCPVFSADAETGVPLLEFQADTGGKYIFCNNPEWIKREYLADNSNRNAQFIMNNENLGPDRYAMFISLVNRTEEPKEDGTGFGTPGFDIEVDVLVRAREDTEIHLSSAGFEVPENKKYYLNGNSYTSEEDLGCFTAWASYLKMPISQLDSGKKYYPIPFEEQTIKIPKGSEIWLGEFIPNYREVPFCRVVHLMADFEIVSGKADINIAALRSTGILSDRSNFAEDAAFGSYIRENQHKGIADTLNQVDANLNFVIDDSFVDGTKLPVTVVNQYAYEGNTVTNWFTNLNPRADPWNKYNAAESSLLKFSYEDPKKLSYYGKRVQGTKDSVWHFDSEHSDTAEFPGSIAGVTKETYSPNFPLSGQVDESLCPNLGNYGVFQNYHITIENQGMADKYFQYKLNTSSNNLIILRDENGEILKPYPLTKGAAAVKESDCLACVKLPSGKSTSFTLTVVLTTNHYGGMENAFVISDTANPVKTYDASCSYNVKDPNFTGRETVKWENGELLKTTDGINFENTGMSETTKDAFKGRIGEMRFLYTPKGYVAKSCLYDGVPYYNVREFYRDVYLLDENFNIKSSHRFDMYATDMSYANGKFYVNAGTIYESEDFVNWVKSDLSEMPVGNGGNIGAYMRNGNLYFSTDGKYYTQITNGFILDYIDSLGNLFYSVRKNEIFLSANAVGWTKFSLPDKITSVGRYGNEVVINDLHKIPVTNIVKHTAFQMGETFVELSKPVMVLNGEAYIPLRAFGEAVGADIGWSAETGAVISYRNQDYFYSENNFDGTIYITESQAEDILKKDIKVFQDVVIAD